MSSDEGSMSDDDLEIENVEEAANVRVVQSSMHASIVQNSLFRVTENKKESENESESEENHEETVNVKGLVSQVEEKHQIMPIIISNIEEFSVKVEEKLEIPPESLETLKNKRKPTKNSKKDSFSSSLQEIFSDKKKPQLRTSDLEKRFSEYNEKRNQRIETLKELKEAEESIICTFKPQTLNKEDPKNFSHFLDHMQLVDKLKKEKLEKHLSEKEENEKLDPKSFKPTLSKGTQKIVKKNKSLGNLHEKLYKESSELRKKKEIDSKTIFDGICSFKPTVSSMSLALKREGQISERLYLESKNKKVAEPEKKTEKLISEESENIIREKFLKEIDQIVLSLKDSSEPLKNIENSENSKNPENPMIQLEYDDFLILLKNLNFLQSNPGSSNFELHQELSQKMWKSFESEDQTKVRIEIIKNTLLGIMNLSNPADNKKLHSEYFSLYESRKSLTHSKQLMENPQTYSFKPVLTQNTEEIAKSIKSKRLKTYKESKPEKVLEMIKKESKERWNNEKNNQDSKIPNECTFQPKTKRGPKPVDEWFNETASLASDYLKLITDKTQHRTEALYNFYKVEQEKKEKNMRTVEDIDIEQNMSECTFTPCLEKRQPRESKNPSNSDKKNSSKMKKTQTLQNFRKTGKNIEKNRKIDNFDTSQSYITDSMRELFRLDTLKSTKQDPEDILSDF